MIRSGSPGVFRRSPPSCSADSWRPVPSPLISKNLFRNNNRKFEREGDADGGFAWLSRDKERVADYRADPFCGATLSAGGLAGMFTSQAQSSSPRKVQGINKNLRIYLFAGSDDPLNNQGKSLSALQKRYREAGLKADLKIYPAGRHEMLNELNREAVTEDLCAGSPRTAMSDPLPAPIWQDALSLCRNLQSKSLSAQTLMTNVYARINALNPHSTLWSPARGQAWHMRRKSRWRASLGSRPRARACRAPRMPSQ